MRIKFLIIFALLILISRVAESQGRNVSYKNIIILSDLSSRINNRPQKDLNKISEILNDFRNNCVKPGLKIGDRSSVLFTPFSNSKNISIDLDYDDLAKKQAFINSKGIFEKRGLDYQIENFKDDVKDLYKVTRNPGLDLISMLNEKISNELQIKKNRLLSKDPRTLGVYYNHIYILTDGYLEFQTKNANSQFYFGLKQISEVRDYCIANNVDVKTALNLKKSFCLPRVNNPINKLIHLHVWETHERDKNLTNQTYKNSIGLRDNEILEAVWRKWATDSGFKSFDWKKY